LIDSEKVFFDGSGRFGDKYQIVIFEEDVRVTNPQFLMASDKLVAFFKSADPPVPKPGDDLQAFTAEPEEPGNQLERAVATGREVTVTKPAAAGGEAQIAKARKATYFADREEVMLEIWPQVQRGNNLVIAKSRDTVIILKGEEMTVRGPVRTRIVGKGSMGGGAGAGGTEGGTAESEEGKGRAAPPKETVIDAELGAVFNRPSARTGEKEVFFDGRVSVADPGFDLFGDDLTAYLYPDEETGETLMRTAVMRGNKVEVQQRTESGARFGKARRVVFMPATGDVRLEQETEIYRGGEWIKGGEVVMLNKDSNDFRQTGGRSKMSFTPGVRPPG
jgi:lipopolysaccharide export system protein LptA